MTLFNTLSFFCVFLFDPLPVSYVGVIQIETLNCACFSDEDVHLTEQTLNGSRLATGHAVPSVPPEARNVRTRPILDVPPRNKAMPPFEAFRLTKELIQKRVKDNIIIVTFGNHAFMDFILTWVQQLNDLEVSNYLVGECFNLRLPTFTIMCFFIALDRDAYPACIVYG